MKKNQNTTRRGKDRKRQEEDYLWEKTVFVREGRTNPFDEPGKKRTVLPNSGNKAQTWADPKARGLQAPEGGTEGGLCEGGTKRKNERKKGSNHNGNSACQ